MSSQIQGGKVSFFQCPDLTEHQGLASLQSRTTFCASHRSEGSEAPGAGYGPAEAGGMGSAHTTATWGEAGLFPAERGVLVWEVNQRPLLAPFKMCLHTHTRTILLATDFHAL